MLRGASNNHSKVIGAIVVAVIFMNKMHQFVLIVVENDLDLPILGRAWMSILWPNWKAIFVNSIAYNANFPEIHTVDDLLGYVDGVCCHLDDVLIYGRNKIECKTRVE